MAPIANTATNKKNTCPCIKNTVFYFKKRRFKTDIQEFCLWDKKKYNSDWRRLMLAQAQTQTLHILKQTLFFSSHLKFKFKN
jgi:hypothetical protein